MFLRYSEKFMCSYEVNQKVEVLKVHRLFCTIKTHFKMLKSVT